MWGSMNTIFCSAWNFRYFHCFKSLCLHQIMKFRMFILVKLFERTKINILNCTWRGMTVELFSSTCKYACTILLVFLQRLIAENLCRNEYRIPEKLEIVVWRNCLALLCAHLMFAVQVSNCYGNGPPQSASRRLSPIWWYYLKLMTWLDLYQLLDSLFLLNRYSCCDSSQRKNTALAKQWTRQWPSKLSARSLTMSGWMISRNAILPRSAAHSPIFFRRWSVKSCLSSIRSRQGYGQPCTSDGGHHAPATSLQIFLLNMQKLITPSPLLPLPSPRVQAHTLAVDQILAVNVPQAYPAPGKYNKREGPNSIKKLLNTVPHIAKAKQAKVASSYSKVRALPRQPIISART